MAEPLKFNVKDKSLLTFFGLTEDKESMRREISPYHLMRDEIILPKRPELANVDEIVFELEDQSQNSRARLVNTYRYDIDPYDDVSLKLTLTSFSVKQFEAPKTTQP